MSFGERLKQFIDFKRVNVRTFEINSSLKNGTIYRVLKYNTSLNGDSIEAIGRAWEELDLNWLILGEGEMLKRIQKTDEVDEAEPKSSSSFDFEAQLERADSQIKLQNDMITLLRDIIEDQKKAPKIVDSK